MTDPPQTDLGRARAVAAMVRWKHREVLSRMQNAVGIAQMARDELDAALALYEAVVLEGQWEWRDF